MTTVFLFIMDNDKAYCSPEVDRNEYMNFALTFDDLLDLEEGDESANFQQNQVESAVQAPEANSSCELRRENQVKNLGKKKHDFDNSEASIQTPTKVMTSDRNSTSPRIIEAHNPKIQWPQNTKYLDISRNKEEYRLHYDPSEKSCATNLPMANLKTNPVLSHPMNKNLKETFGFKRQQQYESQCDSPQNNGGDKHRENLQLVYGQNFGTNTFQTGNIPELRSTNPKPINAIGYIESDSLFNFPRFQNQYSSNGPHPRMVNPDRSVENCPENPKKLPSGSKQTVATNYATTSKIEVDKEMDLLGQNKCLSRFQVFDKVTQDGNGGKFSASPHIRFLRNCSQRMQNKIAERSSLQKHSESNFHQKNEVRNASYMSVQQKHAEKIELQKNEETDQSFMSVQQKNEEINPSYLSRYQTHEERNKSFMRVQQNNKVRNKSFTRVRRKNEERNKLYKNVHQKLAEKIAQKKHSE